MGQVLRTLPFPRLPLLFFLQNPEITHAGSHLPSAPGFAFSQIRDDFLGLLISGFLRTEQVSPRVWECETTVCRGASSVLEKTGMHNTLFFIDASQASTPY